jgi:hypothetical protein
MKVGGVEKTWENKTRTTTYMVGYHSHNDHEALVLDDERIGLGLKKHHPSSYSN